MHSLFYGSSQLVYRHPPPSHWFLYLLTDHRERRDTNLHTILQQQNQKLLFWRFQRRVMRNWWDEQSKSYSSQIVICFDCLIKRGGGCLKFTNGLPWGRWHAPLWIFKDWELCAKSSTEQQWNVRWPWWDKGTTQQMFTFGNTRCFHFQIFFKFFQSSLKNSSICQFSYQVLSSENACYSSFPFRQQRPTRISCFPPLQQTCKALYPGNSFWEEWNSEQHPFPSFGFSFACVHKLPWYLLKLHKAINLQQEN